MTQAHAGQKAGQRGSLYVVATPIGNLKDITLRAIDVLAAVDRVAAEDTRITAGLMAHLGLAKPIFSVHEHNEQAGARKIVEALKQGESVALVTDAGTPGVSDPGARVVAAVRAAGLRVVPVPGPSALTAAWSVAGLSDPHLLWYGFLPAKTAARRSLLTSLKGLPYALAFYESPHRIAATLADFATLFEPERTLVVARELTKLFEEIHVCSVAEGLAWLKQDPQRSRGEFVLIVSGAAAQVADEGEARRVLGILLQELPASQAARLAAQITGMTRKALYALALELQVR
ncbi:16S rRNA (cytidine(1402)-2'-O)-methyltransferase [Thiobacter aerophilum]|uniref:Ribosomal RNA small subunit methyltransferase I n=1 Tax=Thiobacter aerophilum TaxID=3121275 RepID=A0ABV0EFR7_9BURK